MRRFFATIVLAFLASCSRTATTATMAPSPLRTFPTPERLTGIAVDSVQVFTLVDSADLAAMPAATFVPIADATQPSPFLTPIAEQGLVDFLRLRSAPLGANAIVRVYRNDGRRYLAVRMARTGLALVEALTRARFAEAQRLATEGALGAGGGASAGAAGGATGSSTASTPSSDGTVHVKGYTRKDGTYVRPHTRSAPKRP